MKIAILDDYFDTIRTLPCFAKLTGHEVTIWNDHVEDIDALAERLRDVEALVLFRERTAVRRDLIERLPNLKLISQRGVYPHIDIDACTDGGVLVCSNLAARAPSYAAAELTFGLMLAALRRIPQQMRALQQGVWQTGVGHTARNKRFGVYGYGRIGAVVADYARAFGMQAVVFGREQSRARSQADGFMFIDDRREFFASCDVLSLHLRLTPATRGIVTTADLSAMKPSATLINTSRAGLIAPGALLYALQNGAPGAAALDVFDCEPTAVDEPLLALPNVICTPHIGFVTFDEFEIQFADVFDQIVAYQQGAPIHAVNPRVLDR